MTKRMAWIGNPFFARALEPLGWEVRLRDTPGPVALGWEDVLEAAGGEPDVVVLGDRSLPPVLVGVENFPCLTVFYSVDAHIHSWHPRYAQGFDLCLAGLKDFLPSFENLGLGPERTRWSPAFAKASDKALPGKDAGPEWDLLFVGHVDPENSPARHAFLAELGRALPGLEVRRGDYRGLYPRARLVLNYCERGDLNFRVFEALACEACLLTPRIGNGQEELFQPGRDLFTYDVGDMDGLLALVHELLGNPDRRRAVAAGGRGVVDAGHRASHRARALHDWLESVDAGSLMADRLARAGEIRDRHLRLPFLHFAETVSDPALRQAYVRAATGRH